MRKAPRVEINFEIRRELESWIVHSTVPSKQRLRAQIILYAAEGLDDTTIAEKLGISRQRSGRIRARFLSGGLSALTTDLPRPGRPVRVNAEEIVKLTLEGPPPNASTWSQASLAAYLGVSPSSVGRVWRGHGLARPRKVQTSADSPPAFHNNLNDFGGIYLSASCRALAILATPTSSSPQLTLFSAETESDDSASQASSHVAESPPRAAFHALCHSHVVAVALPDPGHEIRFLEELRASVGPKKQIHIAAHFSSEAELTRISTWIEEHSSFRLHLSPTQDRWLRFAEDFLFSVLSKRPGRRLGVQRKLTSLNDAITGYLQHSSSSSRPFIWITHSLKYAPFYSSGE